MVVVGGFGNPLLDCIVLIDDVEIFRRHNLNVEDTKEVPSLEVKELLDEVKNRFEMSCTPGGCVQSTLRLMKWLLREDHRMVMFGAIGADANGEVLRNFIQAAGLETRYEVIGQGHLTGLVISLAFKENRSMVGNIGAAAYYSINNLEANRELLNSMDLLYVEAFFLSHKTGTASRLLKYCADHAKKVAFNLCAEYIIQNETKEVANFVKFSDIVFGNRQEFKALTNLIRGDDKVEDLARQLTKDNPRKCVVVTNGSEPVYCWYGENKMISFSVPKVKENEIVDTTGAGDSFVAGFLAAYILERPPEDCIHAGCRLSQEVIKIIGCGTPPGAPADDFWKL